MINVTRAQRRAEEFIHLWSQVDEDFNQLFSSENLNDNNSLFGKQIPPPITRITDVKIGQHKGIQIDASEMEIERLILLPNHLLSLKSTNVNDSTCHWKLNRIINLDELRVGDLGNEGSDQTSFELWNVSGEDPLKLIFRITCSEIISRNAWVEDLRYAIKEKIECSTESTNVAKTVVDSHINRFWDLQKRFTGIMELSPFHSESVSEIYFDALENVQHISSQSVESSQLSQTDKDGLIRTTFNQKSTSSSSYYTADEPVDDVGKDRIASANLFESYSTLDGVQTPFSEDQQSLTDFQMSPDIRGNQSQLPLRSSLAGNDTLVKQLTVHAGEQIQFNASFTISGPVAYETSWFMNGAPVKPDIGAEMILSDRDTRLLIANADPLMHSGTYTCKCRLFEGTETAVYFCVNVLTAKLSQSDSNENESEQLKLTNIIKSNIFCPVTKELDLPIGKSLEIEVKIDEENVLKFMNTENIQVQWYQDGLLLKPGSTCEMIKSNDRFILRSTSNNLQPDKLYTYTCALKLPDNSFISTAPSLTIPVRLHYPTVKELESELKMNMHKNSSKVNNISIRHVELTKNEAFRLTVPIENNPQNQDCIVWWTNKDKLLAGSHLPPKNTDYEFLVEPNLKANELMFKLFKPSTESEDSGTYRCWIISQSVRNNIVHCADITVIVSNVVSNERHSEEEGEESEGMKTKLEEERQSQENGIKEEETEGEGQKEIGEETKLQDETDEAKRLAEEAESRRRQKEEDEEKKKMEELERKRIEEEEAKRLAEEAESRRRQKEEDEEKKKMEELERKRIEEEEAKRLAEEAESRRRQKEEDEEKKKMEELERKRIEEEEAKRLAEEAESKRRQKEEDKEKKEKPSKLEKEKGEDTHMKSPEKEGKKPKDIGREEAEEKGSDSEEEEKKKKRKRSKSALKGGTAHRTKQIEQSDNKITEKDKSCNKKEELLTEGELKIQEQIKESDRQEDKAIQLKKPVEKDDILGDQLQMTGESMMTNYLQIKSHTHEDQDNTKHLVEASDAIQLEQSKSELESSEDRVVKFDNITSRKDKREKFESQNTNATEEKITICNLKIKSQTDDNQLGALKLDENSDVQKSKIDKSEIETTKEDGEKSYRKIHGSKDKEANKKEKHKEREEPKDRNTLYVAQESRTESSDSYEPKFEPTNKQDRKLKRRENADTSMDYQFISVEKDGQVSESICAREISYQEQSKEENIELEMHVKQTENVEDTTSYTSPGAVPVTKDQMEENEDSRKKHEEQNTEKRAKKDKPKRKKHHERELTKDTTNLESEIRKESKISGGQDNQTTALIGNDQQQQNRKTQKSLVGIEDDVSEDEKQTLSTEEEYRNAMGKNLKVDEKEVGKKMKNRRKSKEVKELELKKVQTGRLNNIFYEDENCDVNPCDFIVLLNGKPIEFNGNQQPLLTIEQNVAQLVLESLSPNQGGIYELRLRKAIEDSLNAQEEVNESTYVANMADFIPSSRFPLIYVEPEKVLPKGEDAKYIHDKSKQQKIFLAELLPKYICMQGETLKLAVELKNNVLVKDFEWLVNGKPVDPESSTDFVVWQTGNWIALTIPNVRSDLTGTYTLHIDTPSGRYTTTGDLSVTGQKRQMTQYVPSQVEGLKPLFTKRLQDYTADVNETVRLSARLVAEPPATIIWKHNGIPVQNDNRVKIHDDHINPSIIIQNVKDEDYGEYICLATNVLGQAETKANLYIQNDSYLKHIKNHDQIDYRIESRTTLSDMAPWRQVGLISGSLCKIDDRKAEPGSQLIYRITPINQLPLLLTSLERCIEDLRFLVLGPNTIQLRWRLGDAIIDALGFRRNSKQSRDCMKQLDLDESAEMCGRVNFSIEKRDGYAGEWYAIHEQISGNLLNKIVLDNFSYLDRDISCRIVAHVDGQQTKPSRPISISIKTDYLVPDFSALKPHVNVTSVEEYLISWEDPDVQSMYTSHILNLTIPKVLNKETSYAVQIQHEGSTEWTTLTSDLHTTQWTWNQPNPLVGYHVRILPSNQFGAGHPTRSTLISPQVVIPDLTYMRPSVESPSEILKGRVAPELVWQIPKSYALDRTFTPYTFEVQVKGVEKSTNRDRIKLEMNNAKLSKDASRTSDSEYIWRVLASGLKRNRLSLEHLDPEQEYWLRVVAVTEYGRSTPSQPVRKMADLNARRNRCSSASIGVLHEPTPTSPTFTEPNTSMIYAPVYGHVELKCVFRPVHPEHETRFTWYFNGKLLDADVSSAYPTLNQKFYSTVSKSGDTAILHLNGIGENDFGTYICKAVHMMGTGEKEFIVKMADAPVFLEVPTPLLTVKLHSRFELRCLIDALPPPTIIWTRDSKRVVESHRTQIGKGDRRLVNRTPSISTCDFSTDATLSIDKCIHQDAGLYTLIAENIAGRVMTSCLIHVEENPVPANITLRWTNIEEHYFVLRRLEHDSSSEVRLLIDKKTNSEYIGKLFNLDNPTSRINGAREMECLTRLCHKNVLKLVDALISDNVLILVCEKLSGSNLLDSVLACENWSEMAAAAIIRSVLEALEHIHSQGVVHYDIQPDNLLFVRKTIGDNDFTNSSNNSDLLRALAPLVTDVLSQTDRHKMNVFSNLLKVIGFSTAQTYITNSQDRIACMPPLRYRPEYVSPEILLSIKKTDGPNTEVVQTYCENLGPAADIWSLGLVGWPPFVDYESGDILTDNILQAIIPFDIPEFENISEEGKDFISKLLQVDPTKRLSAKECLTHPWIQLFSNYEIKSEYILRKLKKYKEFIIQYIRFT
ncbi:unnamed protein product [Heterobilharzia americana]|nr:unnamed protein product [Heterobilharzia americana]